MSIVLVIVLVFGNGISSQQIEFTSMEACNVEAVRQTKRVDVNRVDDVHQTAYCVMRK